MHVNENIRLKPVSFLAVLSLMGMLSALYVDLMIPCLPAIMQQFHCSYHVAHWAITIFMFGMTFSQLIIGPLADHYGRRKVFLGSASCLLLVTLLSILSHSIGLLIFFRFLEALLVCAVSTISCCLATDVYSGKDTQKTFAHMNAWLSLSPGLGPILSANMEHLWQWHSILWLLSFVTFLLICIYFYYIKETGENLAQQPLKHVPFWQHYKVILNHPTCFWYSLAGGFGFSACLIYVITAPFLFTHQFGLTTKMFANLFAINAIGFFVGGLITSHLTVKTDLSSNQITRIGASLITFSGILMYCMLHFVHASAYSIISTNLINAMGISIVLSTSMSAALASIKKKSGQVSSVIQFIRLLMASIAAMLFGELATISYYVLPIGLFVVGSLTFFCATRANQKICPSLEADDIFSSPAKETPSAAT